MLSNKKPTSKLISKRMGKDTILTPIERKLELLYWTWQSRFKSKEHYEDKEDHFIMIRQGVFLLNKVCPLEQPFNQSPTDLEEGKCPTPASSGIPRGGGEMAQFSLLSPSTWKKKYPASAHSHRPVPPKERQKWNEDMVREKEELTSCTSLISFLWMKSHRMGENICKRYLLKD